MIHSVFFLSLYIESDLCLWCIERWAMPKWWKSSRSKKANYFPKSVSTGIFNTADPPDDHAKKKKSRSLTSLFSFGKKSKRQQVVDKPLAELRQQPIVLTKAVSKPEDSIIIDRPAVTSNLKSLINRQTQQFNFIRKSDDSSTNYRQMLTNSDRFCFGFTLPSTTWSCYLYVTVILFLCTCLIISLATNLKKNKYWTEKPVLAVLFARICLLYNHPTGMQKSSFDTGIQCVV